VEGGHLALVIPYTTKAGINVRVAMGRNKLIHTLADYALGAGFVAVTSTVTATNALC
jgi:hypothetical protein